MICENNAANAATLAHYLPILSGHIGKGFFICETLKKCFYANHDLLANFKIRLMKMLGIKYFINAIIIY